MSDAQYPDLAGKRVVISGASTGIGRAAAELFEAQGATVVNLDIAPAAEASFRTIVCDVSDEPAVAAAIAEIESDGGVDVVFANAGITWAKTIAHTSLAELQRVLAVNLHGVYNVARHAFLAMQAASRRGSIVLTSSPHAWRTTADVSAYSISKAGVIAVGNALAIEGGPIGIRVNSVAPGAIDTPILRKEAQTTGDEDAAMTRFGAVRPLRRVGLPNEIGRAVLFLASEASSFMTGSNVVVDGGMAVYLGDAMNLTGDDT